MNKLLFFGEFQKMNEEKTSLRAEFDDYFRKLLKEFDVESPDDLTNSQKADFYTRIANEWEDGKGLKSEFKEKYNM